MLRRFLDWIRSWFGTSDTSIYDGADKGIFVFFDGKETVHADPLVLYRRIMDVAPGLDADIKGGRSALKSAPACHLSAVDTIRDIFNIDHPVNDFDCSGTLTEIQCMALLDGFLKYCDSVKKNSPLTSTSAEVPSPSGEPSNGIIPPLTPSPSGSGSTVTEPNINSLTPSLSEPVSSTAP